MGTRFRPAGNRFLNSWLKANEALLDPSGGAFFWFIAEFREALP